MSVRVRTACVLVLLTRPERFWAPGARAPTPAVCERAQLDAVVAATIRLLQTACHPGRPASPTEVQAAQEKRPEPCRDVFFADLQLHRSAAVLRHPLALVFLTVFADAATQMLFECRCARRHRVQRHPLCQPAESHGGVGGSPAAPGDLSSRGVINTVVHRWA